MKCAFLALGLCFLSIVPAWSQYTSPCSQSVGRDSYGLGLKDIFEADQTPYAPRYITPECRELGKQSGRAILARAEQKDICLKEFAAGHEQGYRIGSDVNATQGCWMAGHSAGRALVRSHIRDRSAARANAHDKCVSAYREANRAFFEHIAVDNYNDETPLDRACKLQGHEDAPFIGRLR